MATRCEECMYYLYDEYDDEYYCSVNLDQDEMERFIRTLNRSADCPMFRFCDDYTLARKQ